MPKTTEQHLIVRNSKLEAEVTVITDCVRGITLLKLTTDGHKASRGLSVTAELLVLLCRRCFGIMHCCLENQEYKSVAITLLMKCVAGRRYISRVC